MSYRMQKPDGTFVYRQPKPKGIRAAANPAVLERVAPILSRETAVDWIPINSENLEAISYNATRETLSVKFRNADTIYRYYEVSKTLFDTLKKAESATDYLRRFVIPKHRVRRFQQARSKNQSPPSGRRKIPMAIKKTRRSVPAPSSTFKSRNGKLVQSGDSQNSDPRPATSQSDSKATGKRRDREAPEKVRKTNAQHRDEKSNLGRGVPAQPTIE